MPVLPTFPRASALTDHLSRVTTAHAVVACVTAIISYRHAYESVSTHGGHGLTARLLPFTVDRLIWAALNHRPQPPMASNPRFLGAVRQLKRWAIREGKGYRRACR
jgi:hypothetical protein